MMIDPRFKLDIISNKSKKKDAREQLEKVFKKYEKRILESTKTQATSSSTASTTLSSSSSPSSSKSNAKQSTPTQTIVNKIKEKITPLSLRFFNESNSKPSQKNELTNYFSEPRIQNVEEDILNWWKINQIRFPVLSTIARDYLAAQATSVPSERGFSRSGLTITNLRNSLHPATVRCLM
jgi:hypothetical protein